MLKVSNYFGIFQSPQVNPNNKVSFTSTAMRNCCDTFVSCTCACDTVGDESCRYKGDIDYRKQLMKNAGLSPCDYKKISSIVGPLELKNLLKSHNEDEKFYLPGSRPRNKEDIQDSHNLENARSLKYGANLHIHTINSDGKLSTCELLNDAVNYANKYAKANRKPFIIAITDHNTVEGCKEAIKIIASNPSKYENLKVILAAEMSTKENCAGEFHFKKAQKIHLLAMCIDPNTLKLNRFFNYIHGGKKTPMYPIELNMSEVVSAFQHQGQCLFAYAHPAYPDIKKCIYEDENHREAMAALIKKFKETAGEKALYVEQYYGGYYGSVAKDERLHQSIAATCDKLNLLKAGGMDSHGESIFFNSVKSNKELASTRRNGGA